MEKALVSVVRLRSYEKEKVARAVEKSLSLLGGIEVIFKPRSRIFVKINLLSPSSPPERGICTQPAFAAEVLRLLKDCGHELVVGDDVQSQMKDCFQTTGYRKVCDELGIPLVNLKEKGFREVFLEGALLNRTYVSSAVLGADYVVNLPKLKTHSFTILTGAVKNMYGVIPAGLRTKYHRQFMKNDVFSQMLVDVFSSALPRLTIMDAVIAMEGEGPSGGYLRNVGVIIASLDAVAVDAVATCIVGLEPVAVFTTFHAHSRGIGAGSMEDIRVTGEEVEAVRVKNFKHSVVALNLFRSRIPSFLYAYFQDQLTLTPWVIEERCTSCGDCINICPTGAARLSPSSAWVDTEKCIHCMCCHEVCRFRAIRLKQTPIGRVMRGVMSLLNRLRTLVG